MKVVDYSAKRVATRRSLSSTEKMLRVVRAGSLFILLLSVGWLRGGCEASAAEVGASESRAVGRSGEKARAAAMRRGLESITEGAARAHVGFLAADELQGRAAGGEGSRIAAQYIVAHLQEWAVEPYCPSCPQVGPGRDSLYYRPFIACSAERQKRGRYYVNPDSIRRLQEGVHRTLHLRNVVAAIPGRRSDEFVIVGAHYDHLGVDSNLSGDGIYNGADDNASGVSAVLQIARAFALSGEQPERTVLFAFWDGEEIGLLGSQAFVGEFEGLRATKLYLNFDMIGRNNRPEEPEHVVFFYTESSPRFGEWLKEDIGRYGLPLKPDYRPWDRPTAGSDNASFAAHDVPVMWYHTDGHPDYHLPGDEAWKINYPKLTAITRAAFLGAWRAAME